MSHARRHWIFFALTSAVLLPAALAQQASQPAKPADPAKAVPPPPPPVADPEAGKSLASSIERFGDRCAGWLKTTLWQQVDIQGLSYHAEGQYLSGPDNRLRLDLKVRVGGTDGEAQTICDGKTVWQAVRIGGGDRVVTKYALKPVLDSLNAPGQPPGMSKQFFQEQAFVSVVPLLQNLRDQLVFIKQEKTKWKDRDVLVLEGVWLPEAVKAIGTPEKWPSSMPRKCVLLLDAQVYWPLRLEWWGPTTTVTRDELLFQIEFRDPQLLSAEAKPPEELTRLFTFNEGDSKVQDQTKLVAEDYRNRGKQMAAQKKTPAK